MTDKSLARDYQRIFRLDAPPDLTKPHDLAVRVQAAIRQEKQMVLQRHWAEQVNRLRALCSLRDRINKLEVTK